MNRSFLSPMLAALVLSAGFAAPALAGNDPVPSAASTLLVSCDNGSRPSQRDVGQLLETNNAGQAYAARGRLMAQVRRACHKEGVQQVALLASRPAPVVAGSNAVALQQ